MKVAEWMLAGVVGVAVVTPGCAPAVRMTGPHGVDHASPEAVLRSLDAAITARDFPALLECMTPANRQSYRRFLAVCKEWNDKRTLLVETVERKIGKTEADRFRFPPEACPPQHPLRHPMFTGKIDWERIRVAIDGDKAEVYVTGVEDSRATCQRVGDLWYISSYRLGSFDIPFDAERMQAFEGMGGGAASTFDLTRRLVEEGKITKSNFWKYFGPRDPGK